MADLHIYSFDTAWICCCIPLRQNQSMIIVNAHMYFQGKKGWCCGFFEGAVGQAKLWYVAQELGGFTFKINLILLDRLELKSRLPYVFSSPSFCQVCWRILLWKFKNCPYVEEEWWAAFLNCSLVLSKTKSCLI